MAGNLKPAPELWKREQREKHEADPGGATVAHLTDEELQQRWKALGSAARKQITGRLRRQELAPLVAAITEADPKSDGSKLPAPEAWNVRIRKEAVADGKPSPTDAELATKWFGMSKQQRTSARHTVRLKVATREAVAASVAAGTASISEQHLLERERARHATKEDYIASKSVAMREWNDRAKRARHEGIQALANASIVDGELQFPTAKDAAAVEYINRYQPHDWSSKFILAHNKARKQGCSVSGCALEKCTLLKLQHDDHVDRSEKTGSLDRLTGTALSTEIAKVQTLCLWHHFVKTRDELNFQPVDARPRTTQDARVTLGLYKQDVGCQCPLHASMPYADIVPSAETDARLYAFLHVSHVNRLTKTDTSAESLMSDLQADPPRAYVYCAFCHALWTLCEDAKASHPGVPYTSDQIQELQSMGVGQAFLEHFESLTKDVDWIGVRVRKSLKLIENNASRKRLRDSSRNVETTDSDDTSDSNDTPRADDTSEVQVAQVVEFLEVQLE